MHLQCLFTDIVAKNHTLATKFTMDTSDLHVFYEIIGN